jgi:hypothetical protein
MPNCFQLISKATGEPTAFAEIDVALCALLGAPVDPVNYVLGWYDTIGFRCALGDSFDTMREEFADNRDNPQYKPLFWSRMLQCVDYLDAHYTTSAWAEIGKR